MKIKTAALALSCLAGTAFGQTKLYFSEFKFQEPHIKSMGLDGSNPQVLFDPDPAQWLPLGIAYRPSDQRMYWVDSGGASEVMSAKLDGTDQVTIYNPAGFCRGVSLDALGRVYFSSDNTVQRVDADGNNPVTIYTDAQADPVGNPRVDATNGHVYIGAYGEIKRMDLDGSNVKVIVRGVSQPRAICPDVAHGYIYWIDSDTQSDFIGRARLDGSDFTVLLDVTPNVVQSPGIGDLVIDPADGYMFYDDEIAGVIYRADLNGQNATIIHTCPVDFYPSALALSTGELVQPLQDCNGNQIADDVDIAGGAPDCDNNGVIDTCQASACPQRTFLLDQGSNAANANGRSLGVPSEWQVFQPFDVPAGGWTVAEIAIDGFTVNYADGSGITIKLFPDNGSGTIPNEAQAIASAAVNLRFNTNLENWVYAPMAATLPTGRYWVRIEANNPTVYQASINLGFSGLPSKSRGSSGTFSNPAGPIALRVVQGTACYANCDGSTSAPILNANDFQCFLNKYAAGDAYANCDHSTAPPVLNANDFQCFLNGFAAGCS